MIVEVKTKLLGLEEQINLNQLIFLSMVLDKNQKPNQDVQKIVSLISDDEISYLIQQGLVVLHNDNDSITYTPTDKLLKFVGEEKDMFDLFYDMYPVYVMRPDGTKSYLRANVNKCRHLFNTYVGKNQADAEHMIKCLEFEISKKMSQGKLSYMKTMWRWLVDHQWEETEEEIRDTQKTNINAYGTELI